MSSKKRRMVFAALAGGSLFIPAAVAAAPASAAAASGTRAALSSAVEAGRSSTAAVIYPGWAEQSTLSKIANALYQQGRGKFADTYSNIYVDVPRKQIVLYATNTARARQLIRAAEAAQPGIDPAVIKVVHAPYSKKAIDARIAGIMAAADADPASEQTIYSAAEAPDGSGIQLSVKPGTPAPQIRASIRQAGSGIPVTITSGTPITPTTWRWNDTAPFIGGDVVVGDGPGGNNACTTGLAVEDVTTLEDYILTAAHCFNSGASVYGSGGPIGDLNGSFGNYFGKVVLISTHFDAEVIDTGKADGNGSNSDDAELRGDYFPVVGADYSLNGESVCQDGMGAYYLYGEGVVCGITITNDDITYNEKWDNGAIYSVQGEESTRSGYADGSGDSGGLVFTICGSDCRDAVGQVSSGFTTSTDPTSTTMFFVDAPDVINQFGAAINPELNPHT